MVKKLLQGLLKKGEKEAEPAKEEDVPDELPPLAEDTVQETAEPAQDPPKDFSDLDKKEAEPAKEEAVQKEPEMESSAGTIKNMLQGDEEPAKIEAEPLKEEVEQKEPEVQAIAPGQETVVVNEVKEEKKEVKIDPPLDMPSTISSEQMSPDITEDMNDSSFFSDLLSLMQGQGIKESVLKQDLYKRMRDYWYYHPPGRGNLKDKDQLKDAIFGELRHLKKLEDRWIMQKKFLDEDRRNLAEKGREIREKIEGLQLTLDQLKLYEDVSEDKIFHLKNGVQIKNVEDLMKALEIIDDDEFKHHLKKTNNDFSKWVDHVVGSTKLAEKLKHTKSRQEMVAVIENELMGNIDDVDPKHYFVLKDGKVLKNITDLLVGLYEIDDETFSYHCKRGDFSMWVKDIFKNDFLAEKIRTADSKEKMIEVLKE